MKNGTFVVTSAGTNSKQFTVSITDGEPKTPAAETGTVRFDSGSVTVDHFESSLTAAVADGYAICQETKAYNGPYKIQAVGDPQDIVFYDGRIGAATETSGSCYVLYQVTIKNAVIAGPGQQIVAANREMDSACLPK